MAVGRSPHEAILARLSMGKKHSPKFLAIVNAARNDILECEPGEFRGMIEDDESLVVIDVRERHEYEAGHLVDSIHIGKGVLEGTLKNTKLVRGNEWCCTAVEVFEVQSLLNLSSRWDTAMYTLFGADGEEFLQRALKQSKISQFNRCIVSVFREIKHESRVGRLIKGELSRQDAEKRRCSSWLEDCINMFVKLESNQKRLRLTCSAKLAWLNGDVNRSTVRLTVQPVLMLPVALDTRQSKVLLLSNSNPPWWIAQG